MTGGFKHVWKRLWTELWLPLAENRIHPEMFFADVYRGLKRPPRQPVEPDKPSAAAYDSEGRIIDLTVQAQFEDYNKKLEEYRTSRSDYELACTGQGSREAVRSLFRSNGDTELEALAFLRKIYIALEDLDEPDLLALYKRTLSDIIETYNLGYVLVDPFVLAPTVQGVIFRLFGEIRRLSDTDTHIQKLYIAYEEACIDLSNGATSGRIQSCIHKQFMLSEGIAKKTFNIQGKTLGAMCDEISTWPHITIREVAKKLYGFRSDYPGFGHGSNPEVSREVDLRDFIGVSCMLAGLLPYLHADIDINGVYRG